MDFLISLLNDYYTDTEYSSPLISGLAILGLTEQDTWRDAKEYTPILSSIITISRFLVLQKAYNSHNRLRKIYPKPEDPRAKSYWELTKEYTQKTLTLAEFNSLPTPFNWISKLRSYGLTIRYNTSEVGSLDWIGDELFYEDISISIEQLREFVQDITTEARNLLF